MRNDVAELTLTELEQRFDLLKEQRDSLRAALPEDGTVLPEHVDELNRLQAETARFNEELRAYTIPDLHDLRSIMGTNLIGPDVWEKIGLSCTGAPPPLPEELTEELLNSECKLGGRLIKDTNRLVYVPAGLTILELVEKANEWCDTQGITPAFWKDRLSSWLKNQDFAKEGACGGWVLIPLSLLPDSTDKTDAEQVALMEAEYPEYETPDARAVLCALIGEYIQTGTRTWPDDYGRCQNNVLLGGFKSIGLSALQLDVANEFVGRAACRKFTI